MTIYFVISILSIIIGLAMILFGFIGKKHLAPWFMMLMIFCGIFVIVISFIMFLCLGTFFVPLSN
ncbi:MAG TPA: hypothetical protein DCW90_06980 [Lachnospiraceae bacterium]|nr:hypothetical protein [Lachnospiraceae bacterium]